MVFLEIGGTDPTSPVAGYNVQRLDAERTWVDISVGTTATQVALDGGTNGRDRIRVQALDAAGNASAWVDSGLLLVASTTKYYALGGQAVAVQRGGELSYLTGDHLPVLDGQSRGQHGAGDPRG